jgi:hypothetical protein
MSKSEFDAFVKRQQAEEQKGPAFDPKQQLNEWLNHLDALYKQITVYLQAYVESKAARIEYNDIQLNEEFVGPYAARELFLHIGRSTVIFTPIGTMLIGMKGRVDVRGPSGRATLYLINKQVTTARSLIRVTVTRVGDPAPSPPLAEAIKKIEWVWKIGTPPPDVKFIELTQEAFFGMVLEVANA